LYFWRIDGGGGDIVRMPLQGALPMATPFWGPSTGKSCSGCHAVSPDGRFVALVDQAQNFAVRVVDTMTELEQTLSFESQSTLSISWRPDVNSAPPYQFAFDDERRINIASVTGGLLGTLTGADSVDYYQKMASWGPNGRIAFARSRTADSIVALSGTSDIMLIDEGGGTPVPLAGASGNGKLNYYPAFSPDGRWIAFTQSLSPNTYAAADAQIRLVGAAQEGQVHDLLPLNGDPPLGASSYPSWSVDGSLLSFSSNRDGGLGGWDIWIAPIDAGGEAGPAVNLVQVNTPEFEHIARWAP
jgi:Tol biopolymer transport system component